MLCTVMLLGLTLVAAATDVLRNKIYNWNTYTGILAGLALGAATSAAAAGGAAETKAASWLGAPSFVDCLGGLLTCGLLMVVCFSFFRGMGGGDVKLVAMLGALMGVEKGLDALLWTFVLGACFSLVLLVWRMGPLAAASTAGRLLATRMRLPWFRPLSGEERKMLNARLWLSPGALAAVVIVRFGLVEVVEKVLELRS